MPGGPQAYTRQEREVIAAEIAARLQYTYEENLIALGIYGSMGKAKDEPYSDIEMHCVLLHGKSVDSIEWTPGPWKAEVDFYTQKEIIAKATKVEFDWSITHSAFTNVAALFDPQAIFPKLSNIVLGTSLASRQAAIHELIVGDVYELIGKLRNARRQNHFEAVPFFFTKLAQRGACLAGLANNHLYQSLATIFSESLTLEDLPGGYEVVSELVMQGKLDDFETLFQAADDFWNGIEVWARKLGLQIEIELAQILPE